MKVWLNDSDIIGMRKDVAKLRLRTNAYLLVTSINPPELTCGNFRYLCEQVDGLQIDARIDHRFNTKGYRGDDMEFWIAGWPLAPESPSPLKK